MQHRNNHDNYLLVTGIYADEMNRILTAALALQPEEDQKIKKGCFLAVCDSETGKLLAQQFGEIASAEKKRKYLRCATEKVTRLFERMKEIRSFESADDDKDWFGGGVHCHVARLIVACSGFSAKLDEAIATSYVSFCIAVASRSLSDVYKDKLSLYKEMEGSLNEVSEHFTDNEFIGKMNNSCLLYTSDAADE